MSPSEAQINTLVVKMLIFAFIHYVIVYYLVSHVPKSSQTFIIQAIKFNSTLIQRKVYQLITRKKVLLMLLATAK